MTRLLALAHKFAPRGQHKNYRMAALVVRGGAVISLGVNKGWHHAESRALKPHDNYRGAKVYVAREGAGCSKPCKDCWEKLKAAGIDTVSYIDADGQPVTEKIS